jgi:8-oxo-dGTP pyrophosphatase MutT (NUDIX family)
MGHALMNLYVLAQSIVTPVAYAVAGAVTDRQGRILIVRHSYKPGWQLPLGGVDRGEPASDAVLRELKEEIGLTGGAASLFGIYTRKAGWATNVIALYRVTEAIVDFRPNLEIREIAFADPAAPPAGCTDDTLRRLEELAGRSPPRPYW